MSNFSRGDGERWCRSKGPEVGSKRHIWERVASEEQDEVRKMGPDKSNKARMPDPRDRPNSVGSRATAFPAMGCPHQNCALGRRNQWLWGEGGSLARSEMTRQLNSSPGSPCLDCWWKPQGPLGGSSQCR